MGMWDASTYRLQPVLPVDLQTTPSFGSLRSTRGPAPAHPLNNKSLAVATNRLVCVTRCVCTALCVHRQTTPCYGSLHSTQGGGGIFSKKNRGGAQIKPDFRPARSPAGLLAGRSAGRGSAEPISPPSRYVRRTQVRLNLSSPNPSPPVHQKTSTGGCVCLDTHPPKISKPPTQPPASHRPNTKHIPGPDQAPSHPSLLWIHCGCSSPAGTTKPSPKWAAVTKT